MVPIELWERLSKEAEDIARSLAVKARESDADDVKGLYTVICLDASASMAGERWTSAQSFLQKYLHQLEIEATEFERYDHVALVVFGSEIKVAFQYTLKYSKILDYCGSLIPSGSSNLFAALALCYGVIQGGFIRCVYDDRVRNYPRVILISDGYATRPNVIGGPDADMGPETYLRRLSVITGGRLLTEDPSENDSMTLKRFLRQHRNYILGARQIRDRFQLPSVYTSPADVEDIREIISEQSATHEEYLDDGNHLLEVPASMPPLGARVRRGPEWRSFNLEDEEGCGTVVGHREDGRVHVHWDNRNKGVYLYGRDGRYEVIIVEEPRVIQDENLIAVGCQVMPGPDWESEDEENQTIKQDDVGVVIRIRPYGIVKVVWSSGKVQGHCYGFKNILEVQAYRRRLPSVRYVPMIHNPKAEIRANDKKQQGPPPTQETIQLSESTTGTTNSMPLVVNSVTEQTKTLSSTNAVSTISNKPKRNKNVTLCATPNRSRSNSFSLPQVSSPRDRVVWQHRMRDKSWKDFPIDISDKVEHIFLKNPSGTLLFDQNGQPYKIIPSTLQLIHLSTKTTSKIRRILQ